MKLEGIVVEKVKDCDKTGDSIDQVKKVEDKAEKIEYISKAMTLKYNGKLRVTYFNSVVKNES